MNATLRILAVLALLLAAGPARADLDQKCLADCANAGHDASVCLPQCSYNLKPKITAAAPAAAAQEDEAAGSYSVLTAPRPVDNPGALDVPRTGPIKTAAPIDRTCLAACLHKNFQYDLCNETCAKQVCGNDAVLCANKAVSPLDSVPHN